MSSLVAGIFIALGLLCAVKPDWVAKHDRATKAFGTDSRPEDIELEGWWEDTTVLLGIGCVAFGLLVLFDLI